MNDERQTAPALDDDAVHGLLEWMRVVDGCAADTLTNAGVPPEKLAALARECLVSRARSRRVAEDNDALRRRLRAWVQQYGASLKPIGADTYGNGMREAKLQVDRILGDPADTEVDQEAVLREWLYDAIVAGYPVVDAGGNAEDLAGVLDAALAARPGRRP